MGSPIAGCPDATIDYALKDPKAQNIKEEIDSICEPVAVGLEIYKDHSPIPLCRQDLGKRCMQSIKSEAKTWQHIRPFIEDQLRTSLDNQRSQKTKLEELHREAKAK